MIDRDHFERIIKERYAGADIIRIVTVHLPSRLELHAAVLEDQHGRFAIATQEGDEVERVGESILNEAVELYEAAIVECHGFLRDLRPPVRPGGAVAHWVDS